MKKYILIYYLFVILLIISCDNNDNLPISEHTEKNSTSISKNENNFQKIQDSILSNYSQAIRLINQIDGELNKLSNVPSISESQNYEQDILKKIDYFSFQLKSANSEINKLQLKIKSLGKENKEYLARIKTLEIIIEEKDKIINNQKERISYLENELQITKSERDLANIEKANIEKFASETEIKKNTAYFIIGNEKTLKSQNIIKMEGKGFLGIGGKYVLSPEAELKYFTKIDIVKDTLLPFPSNSIIEEIISTHSRKLLEIQNSQSGNNFLRIINPETFWRTDKLLIIMIEEK